MMIRTVVVGEFQANCYLVVDEQSGKGMLIDPGGDAEALLALVEQERVELVLVIVTHAHIDHIGALDIVRRSTGAKAVIHSADACSLQDPDLNLSVLMNQPQRFELPEVVVEHGSTMLLGKMTVQFIHTPGHTPGSISVLVDEHVFTGDCLFAGGIGRVDLPGGNWDALTSSIKERLYLLPDVTKVFPGHGPETTIGKERKSNPYVRSS